MSEATQAELEAAVRFEARLAGCTCRPDVTVEPGDLPNLHRAQVAHDDSCGLLRRRLAGTN